MKKILFFIFFTLVGVVAFLGFTFLRKNPGKPINNIVETVVTPTFSIEDAPSESIRGNIVAMSGEIFWESRIATEASLLTQPIVLQQGEEIQTKETGAMEINFPKITNIKVLPKTQIAFVQTLPVEFVTSIASGSAELTKTGDTPISIRLMHLLVRLNAGDLSIGVDQDNSLVNLNILKGAITVAFNDNDLNSKVMKFNAPQRITFNDLLRRFE